MKTPGLNRDARIFFRKRRLLAVVFFTVGMVAPFFLAHAESVTPTPAERISESDSLGQIENSVVKVFANVRLPDPFKPWTRQAPTEVTGSGVIIDGKRILTNAHVVLYASEVQVQANQSGDKVSATVEAIAPGIDLAVLKVEDDSLFEKRPPLKRANTLPDIKDAVMVYGFPTGGASLSITKGIVSRIEFAGYNYPTSGLRIQIDAAINPGNSGGPAVVGNKLIGLAFSHLQGAQNIGYIIPCEEIELFLEDISHGRYNGKPALFDEFQTLENGALRSFLKLDKTVEGMVVHQAFRNDPSYPLKEWDVVTKIGDTQIDNQGMIRLNGNLRISFRYLVQKIARNGSVPLTVVRANKTLKLNVPVESGRPLLIASLQGAYPSYFVFGPLVFSRATSEFVGGFNSGGNSLLLLLSFTGSPLATRLGDAPAAEAEELVVVSSPFFPHRLSKGYSNPLGAVVKSVNDTPIKSFRHLVEVLRDGRTDFIKFEFSRRGGETLVFPRRDMIAATDEILTDNGIRSQGSPDAMAVWTGKPAR
jgi:S1-C subfamily serine protease